MSGLSGKTLPFVVAGLAFAGAAQAAPVAIACNACSLQTIEQRAGALGTGIRYFYNLSGNTIYKVRTDCEPGMGGTTVCIAAQVTTPTNVNSAFATYRSAVNANNQSEHFKATVSVSLPSGNINGPDGLPMDNGSINAWGTILNSNYNNQVIARINSPATYSGAYGLMMSVLAPINNPVVSFNQMSAVVDVVFPDGSTRSYKLNMVTNKYEPIPGSAIDSHNNTLPDSSNPTPMNGTQYVFGGVPGWNAYDYRNIYFYFHPQSFQIPESNGCAATRWDGEALTCVQPR